MPEISPLKSVTFAALKTPAPSPPKSAQMTAWLADTSSTKPSPPAAVTEKSSSSVSPACTVNSVPPMVKLPAVSAFHPLSSSVDASSELSVELVPSSITFA